MTKRAIGATLSALARSRFRSSFQLSGRDAERLAEASPQTIRWHARDIVERRLAEAHPRYDGRQTPYAGHPVFVAQHATATCCRTCLAKWYKIGRGQPMSNAQIETTTEIICAWLERRRQLPRQMVFTL